MAKAGIVLKRNMLHPRQYGVRLDNEEKFSWFTRKGALAHIALLIEQGHKVKRDFQTAHQNWKTVI
jgi:hypothetical protein